MQYSRSSHPLANHILSFIISSICLGLTLLAPFLPLNALDLEAIDNVTLLLILFFRSFLLLFLLVLFFILTHLLYLDYTRHHESQLIAESFTLFNALLDSCFLGMFLLHWKTFTNKGVHSNDFIVVPGFFRISSASMPRLSTLNTFIVNTCLTLKAA